MVGIHPKEARLQLQLRKTTVDALDIINPGSKVDNTVRGIANAIGTMGGHHEVGVISDYEVFGSSSVFENRFRRVSNVDCRQCHASERNYVSHTYRCLESYPRNVKNNA